jgi:hypothetical protein
MTKIESTKCNKCISSGGGDCATCDPPETTARPEPEHCDHYDVCYIVHTRKDHVCPSDPNNKTCDYDTRSHQHNPAPETFCPILNDMVSNCWKSQEEHDKQVKKQERERVLKSAMCEVEIALNKVEVRKRQAHHDLVDAMEMIRAAENALKSLRGQHEGNCGDA